MISSNSFSCNRYGVRQFASIVTDSKNTGTFLGSYAATNRIYKHYHMHFEQNKAEVHHRINFVAREMSHQVMSFSSYAGSQMSLDDFYLMSSGLAMIQTTLWVLDKDTHMKINPEALLAWQSNSIVELLVMIFVQE